MGYIAKSQWTYANILDKLNRGALGIEIQLLNPDKDECLDLSYKIPDEFKTLPIKALHTPLNAPIFCNYDIETPIGQREFVRVLILAEKLIDKTSRKLNIICHMNQSIKNMKELEILKTTYDFIALQAMLHPNCTINIENVTDRLIGVYDNAVFVRSLNLPNVGTVIDTCHVLMDEFITGRITNYGANETDFYRYETLEKAFLQNKDVCKWIHLNNASYSNGFLGDKEGHGTPFEVNNKEDMEKLIRILRAYKTLDFKPPLSLEVREDDYLNCVNFSKTSEALDEAFKIVEN